MRPSPAPPHVPCTHVWKGSHGIYLFRWLYTRMAISCSLRVSCRCTRQVKRSWCSARPNSLRACSEDTSRKFCGARVGQSWQGQPPSPTVIAALTLSFMIRVPCKSRGFLASGSSPVGMGHWSVL